MKTIEIVVSPAGEARIETRGYTGNECQQASLLLEAALGMKRLEQLTPAYFQQHEETTNHLSLGGTTAQP